MEEKKKQTGESIEIDLQRVFSAIWSKAWLLAIVSVLCAVLAFVGTFYFITPQYESSAMFYVNNNSISMGDTSLSISSSDLVASRNLVNTYSVILRTRETINMVIDYAGVDRTYSEVKDMITAAAVDETEIFCVTVTSPDPQEAKQIADAIAYILPSRIKTIIKGSYGEVVDNAVIASSPSSPSYTKNTILGFVLGLLLTVAVIVLKEIFDITIRTEEDIEQSCRRPILAAVPDMTASSKGSYYYGYGNKRKSYAIAGGKTDEPVLVGAGMSFAASEAYKLLRTKLQFSFSEESDSRVIGVSSAMTCEGKSLSAINVAYMLAQLNKKVVLIDCDMRRPSIAAKLSIEKTPGLSSYLSAQSHMETLIQKCGIKGEEDVFDVVVAGRNPPNPIELLSSDRMGRMLTKLREQYDYIILDLPPVGEVSDALAVAKLTDGMLLVVRQHYCNRLALSDTVRQFEFVGAKILGIVYNCADEHGKNYGKGYYRRGYRSYGRRYEGNYLAAEKAARRTAQSADDDSKK